MRSISKYSSAVADAPGLSCRKGVRPREPSSASPPAALPFPAESGANRRALPPMVPFVTDVDPAACLVPLGRLTSGLCRRVCIAIVISVGVAWLVAPHTAHADLDVGVEADSSESGAHGASAAYTSVYRLPGTPATKGSAPDSDGHRGDDPPATITAEPARDAPPSSSNVPVSDLPGASEPIKPIPEELEMNPEKVALGRALFHDPRLSKDDNLACVSCHDLGSGGDDGHVVSIGIEGKFGSSQCAHRVQRWTQLQAVLGRSVPKRWSSRSTVPCSLQSSSEACGPR